MTGLRILQLTIGSIGLAALLLGAEPLRAQGDGNGSSSFLRASPEEISGLLDPIVRRYGSRVGVAVYAVDRKRPLYLHNAEKPLVPASNMKLFTTAAALDRLGPDFQFTTSIYADGALGTDGTIEGNLILVGRGDPALSGRFYADSVTYVFDRFAAELRDRGVTRISGDLIGDNSFFDDYGSAPGWEERHLLWWYGARASALAFNDNVVTLEVRPGPSIGSPPIITPIPYAEDFPIVNRAKTSGRRGRSVGVGRRPDIGGYEIWGRVPLGSGPARYVVALEDPPRFTISVLRDRLKRVGIEIDGVNRVVNQADRLPARTRTLVASHTSPRLVEMVNVINKNSHNFFAEQVLKSMGAVFTGRGTYTAGAQVVRNVLENFGLPAAQLINDDGSGLSLTNLVTAQLTAQLLVSMRAHPWFIEFYDSLLLAGTDGNKRRLDAPDAVGNVRTKTGTLRGVSALSGYVTTRDGELLAFSVISNRMPGGKGAAVTLEDRVAERLASYSAWANPAGGVDRGR